MIRRLLYHFFWNFYDYLGSYALLGAGSVFALLGLLTLGYMAGQPLGPVPKVVLVAAGVALGILVLAVCLAGLFAFADRAARDEPARFPHVGSGARELTLGYVKLLLVALLVKAIVAVNVVFYMRAAAAASSGSMRMLLFVLAMFFVWMAITLYLYAFPALATVARHPGEGRLREHLRKAAIFFVIAPVYWFFVATFFMILLSLCVVSLVGVIFVIPVLASLSTSALDVVVRHVEFLTQARQQLGEGRSPGEYRRKAVELGWEWEYRQPRRTLREMIKPWES